MRGLDFKGPGLIERSVRGLRAHEPCRGRWGTESVEVWKYECTHVNIDCECESPGNHWGVTPVVSTTTSRGLLFAAVFVVTPSVNIPASLGWWVMIKASRPGS